MAYKTTTKGIVLSRSAFGESDLYVHFLTQNFGIINVLAKGARRSKRRYVGGLDLFCHDELFLRGDPRETPYLLELSVLNSFAGLRLELEKTVAAGKCVQWVRKLLSQGNIVHGVYSLLGQTLALMEKEAVPARVDVLLLIFRFKLLKLLGLRPQFENCVSCGNLLEPPFSFDVAAGGAHCKTCASALTERTVFDKEDFGLIKGIDSVRLGAWADTRLGGERVRPWLAVLTQFANYHTHTHLPV